MILALGEKLEEIEKEVLNDSTVSAVFVTNSEGAERVMKMAGMEYDGEIRLSDVAFCKLETQQECLAGSLCIPKLLDVLGSRYRILFFVNRQHIVIVDDNDFSYRLIRRIRKRKSHQGESKEIFLYNFISQFMRGDQEILTQYERRLMEMEEEVSAGKIQGFQSNIRPLRRELLTLRGYYDEMMDMGKELEENENHFFAKKHLKYFGTISDRADRLMTKTAHLLEYAQQVRDAYQAQVDERQNSNMQFLTVISTIFFPLTLITGWYGMNFKDMPGLEDGYPYVVLLSLTVVIVCIIVFKKKKIF